MMQINSEEERKRLSEVYAQQSDEELASVAKQGYELTEVARETLRAELVKRGLYSGQLEDISPPGEDHAEYRNLMTVRTFSSLTEAELAKGLLDTAGIESFLFDENMGRIYWTNAVSGVRLRVDPANIEDANRVLDEQAADDGTPDEQDSTL